ncbi:MULTISPECIES: hypothetical protein [unclassified Novosphingobium]|uniref:hypothetical protein n=1 Tax=unclassified Novosphingobium TaxID=2644732 RepID=UPI00146B3BB2|nr:MULTISPECIES: hypothetical protein [unclassified Novosphingobium]NMN06418.1 hypothetical protein [Novosphingobium sp. SG919]NMN89137.1 hypothetical protein [Novosphingobium sp. SG916]
MQLGPSPFEWLEFDKNARCKDLNVAARLQALLSPEIKDLVVISHGWNNDLPDAEQLYATLWQNAADELIKRGRDPASFAVVGILWPAKAYDAIYDGAGELVKENQKGGTMAVVDRPERANFDVPVEHLEAMIAQVRAFADDPEFDKVADAARAAAATPEKRDESAAYEFFRAAMASLDLQPDHADPELTQDASIFRRSATISDANDLLLSFGAPLALEVSPGVGAAQGLGDVLRGTFQGARSGVVWALNKLTYYTMKKRAGTVGDSVADLIGSLQPQGDVRLHFVGHSFGARLVTAAGTRLVPPSHMTFRSVTLLQGAYSHNGLTAGKGPFSALVGKPSGPISFSHTHNDQATTIAYPLASRLSGDATKSLGDANDIFGAMGANGPQMTGDMMAPDCDTTDFHPVPGKINRFLADTYVVKTEHVDAHNNVTNVDCGRLVAATMTV